MMFSTQTSTILEFDMSFSCVPSSRQTWQQNIVCRKAAVVQLAFFGRTNSSPPQSRSQVVVDCCVQWFVFFGVTELWLRIPPWSSHRVFSFGSHFCCLNRFHDLLSTSYCRMHLEMPFEGIHVPLWGFRPSQNHPMFSFFIGKSAGFKKAPCWDKFRGIWGSEEKTSGLDTVLRAALGQAGHLEKNMV